MRTLLALAFTLIAGAAMAQAPSLPPEVIAAARRPVVTTLPGMDRAVVTRACAIRTCPRPASPWTSTGRRA